MLFAGLMFKEGEPQEPTPPPPIDGDDAGKQVTVLREGGRSKWSKERPDELAFIIAEKAQRRTSFLGI